MRILQFCSKPPLPAVDGGCIASFELSKNLIGLGHDVSLLSLSTEKHPFEITDQNRDFYLKTKAAEIPISTQKSWVFYLLGSFSNRALQERRFQSKASIKSLKNYLAIHAFDLVIFDGLMSATYSKIIKQNTKIKMIYRSHNIEHVLLNERANNNKNSIKKYLLKKESQKIEKLEKLTWNQVDQVWSISRSDCEVMRSAINNNSEKYIPFSSTDDGLKTTEIPNTFFHLGAMDWGPNLIGLTHFLNTSWKHFSTTNSFELHLGGKNISEVKNLLKRKNVTIHEHIADADAFYANYEIMIVPIMTGSGIRIKSVQAMCKGKAIITTEIGAKGIPAENGKHMLICKTDEEMLFALVEITQNNELKERLKKESRLLYESEFSPEFAKTKISQAIAEL